MKKTILAAFAALTATISFAQTDTLTIEHPERVVISKDPQNTNIVVEGSKENPNYRYEENITITDNTLIETVSSDRPHSALGLDFTILEKKNDRHSIEIFSNPSMMAGFTVPSNGAPIKFGKSFDLEINLFTFRYLPASYKWWVDLNVGLCFSNYSFKNGQCMLTDREGIATMNAYLAGTSDGESVFYSTGGQYSLMPYRTLGKGKSIGLGLVWQANQPLFCRSSYTDVDGLNTTKTGHFAKKGINSNRFGMRLEYRMDMISFYGQYMFTDTFKKGFGPAMPSLTLGFGVYL